MSSVNRSHEGGIFAWMFTKRQPGCCGGHWVLSLSGNCCKVVHIALERAIAASRVRREPTARVDREVGRFLYRLDGKVPRRLDHDTSLAADPRDDGGPILVVMAAPGLAFLAAPPRCAAQ